MVGISKQVTKCIVCEGYSTVFELLKRAFRVLRLDTVEGDWNVWYATCLLDVFHTELNRFYSNITENVRVETIATDLERPFPDDCDKTSLALYTITIFCIASRVCFY